MPDNRRDAAVLLNRLLVRSGLGLLLAMGYLAQSGCCTGSGKKAHFSEDVEGVNIFVSPAGTSVKSAAVLPFKAPTELIGSSVSDLFVSEFLRMRAFALIERSQLSGVLTETELSLSGISNAKAMEVGQLAGAEGVVVGTVTEYEMNAYKGRKYPAVGVALRMIDSKSGKIVWSADYAERAPRKGVSLAEHSRNVVHKIASALHREVARLNARDPGTLPAPPPQSLAISAQGLREVSLTWTPSRGTGDYTVERATSPSGPFKRLAWVPPSAGRYTDTGTEKVPLGDGITYYYRMCHVSERSEKGPYTETVKGMTVPAPTPVVDLRAGAGFVRCIPLTWRGSAEDTVTGYDVERSETPHGPFELVKHVRGRNRNDFQDGGREPGKLGDAVTYFYRVFPVNRVGARSEMATIVTAMTRNRPPTVKGLTATGSRPREVPLTWQMSPDEKVRGYVIERAEGEESFEEVEDLRTREATAWNDRGGRVGELGALGDQTAYRYRICAYNIAGVRSAWCDPVDVLTKPLPSAPTDVAVSRGAPRRIDVTWQPVPEDDAVEYPVEYRESGSRRFREIGKIPASKPPLLISIPDLTDDTAYECRIATRDTDGLQSVWSEISTGKTKPLPPPPTLDPPVLAPDGSVTLEWIPPPGVDVAYTRIYQVKLFGRKQVAQSESTSCTLPPEASEEGWKIILTTIDKDALESEPSEEIELEVSDGE